MKITGLNGERTSCAGWDIGGANLKAVWMAGNADAGPDGVAGGPRQGPVEPTSIRIVERPFEVWRDPAALPSALVAIAAELAPTPRHAVTMTAELADCFTTKREGVHAVLAAVSSALPGSDVRVLTAGGRLIALEAAFRDPLLVAAANWAASAGWLARTRGAPGVLVDVGSTTTDVVPFAPQRVLAHGRSDLDRLLRGELVYTGSRRTPICAILRTAPFRGAECPVAAEHFAIAADAHLWLGDVPEVEYGCATPDGGPATRQGAAARLARVICADLEVLNPADVTAIARRVAEAQVEALAGALDRMIGRLTLEVGAARPEVVVAGSGAWLAEAAAHRLGLPVDRLADTLGKAARVLPAFATAWLAWKGATGGLVERA